MLWAERPRTPHPPCFPRNGSAFTNSATHIGGGFPGHSDLGRWEWTFHAHTGGMARTSLLAMSLLFLRGYDLPCGSVCLLSVPGGRPLGGLDSTDGAMTPSLAGPLGRVWGPASVCTPFPSPLGLAACDASCQLGSAHAGSDLTFHSPRSHRAQSACDFAFIWFL